MVTTDDFRRELLAIISRANRQGRLHVEINAGELHRVVGDYPNPEAQRMTMACNAMREVMTASDEVIFAPRAGNGASFTIRYKLPR